MNDVEHYQVADHLFFLIENGQILIWNYKNHEQYILELDYFLELLNFSLYKKYNNNEIFNELLESKLIINHLNSGKWEWDMLSKIFHIGTKNCGSDELRTSTEIFSDQYLKQCAFLNELPKINPKKNGKIFNLPQPDIDLLKKVSYYSALINRKTSREFKYEYISSQELSLILYFCFGDIHGDWEDLENHNIKNTGQRKTSPSSGGIRHEQIYLIVYRIHDIPNGLYYYNSKNHHLIQLKLGNFEKNVIDMNYNQFFSEGMSFGIYITSDFKQIWWKYKHSRAYRAMLLDIGHISQVFLTCATALEMQTWITASFSDSEVEKFLDINEESENPILFVGAGKGFQQSIPKIIREKLNKLS